MAEERVFSIDLGDELGSVYVVAVWKDGADTTPSPVRKPKSPHKQRPKVHSLSLLLSDGLQVWKGNLSQWKIKDMQAKSPYGEGYLDKLYEAFSGPNEASDTSSTPASMDCGHGSSMYQYTVDPSIKELTVTAEAEEGLVVSLATVTLTREEDGAAALKRLIATLATRKHRLDDQLAKLSQQEDQIEKDMTWLDQRLDRLDDEQTNQLEEHKYKIIGNINRIKKQIREAGQHDELFSEYLTAPADAPSLKRTGSWTRSQQHVLDQRVKSMSQEMIDTDNDDDMDPTPASESLELTQPSQVNPMLAITRNADKAKRRRRGGRVGNRTKRAKAAEDDDDDDLL
eukprot:m.37874 g.37874  ORF g.37874 m.37874 type:complete len:341 (+) comp12551_c0_seq1:89-1111(+)